MFILVYIMYLQCCLATFFFPWPLGFIFNVVVDQQQQSNTNFFFVREFVFFLFIFQFICFFLSC